MLSPSSRAIGVTLAVATTLASVACSSRRDDPTEHEATGAQAIQLANFTGSSLPAKTIALTFDDGPGSRTLELSAFLRDQGIQATFFENGHCYNDDQPCGNKLAPAAILAQLEADGHLIGNHTQDHLDLTTTFPAGADGDAALLAQLTETDAIIAPYVASNHWLFRAPFGYWNSRDYTVVHGSAMDKYVGPINWDAGGGMTGDDVTGYAADWDCWENQDGFGLKTSAVCGTRYLNEINAVGHGIVLMHDGDKGTTINNHDINNGAGNTVDMVKLVVVPALKAQGYTFVRADSVPAITAALGVPPCDASCSSCSGPAANQCTGCRAGSFLVGGTCKTCSSCAANSYQVSACAANADAVCAACTVCAAGTFTEAGCSATANTVCGACDASCTTCSGPTAADCDACPSGAYRKDGACVTCSQCPAGTATTAACASSSDTTCTACAAGTFAADPGSMTCASCGSCDDGDACTTDTCDATAGCVHEAISGCSPTTPTTDAGSTPPASSASDAGSTPSAPTPTPEPDAGTEDAPPSGGGGGEGGCATSAAPRPAGGSAFLLFALSAWLLRRRSRTLAA